MDLESKCSEICNEKLVQQFITGDLDPPVAGSLQKFLRGCRPKISTLKKKETDLLTKPSIVKDDCINREDEVSKLLSFFDSGNEFVIEITGMSQIGKSTAIKKAIDRTAFRKIKRIPLLNTSSAQYIVSEISSQDETYSISVKAGLDNLKELQYAIEDWDIIWLENCEQLSISGKWKSSEIETLINRFVSLAQNDKINIKFIFESAAGLPFNLRDPSVVKKLKIWGFERDRIKHGVAILDQQLRRLDRKPGEILLEVKNQIVRDLGGHPLAIIFCADAIYDEGLTAVINAIKKGTGFYREVTDRIINNIISIVALSEKDEKILRILSGCRIEAPRDVVINTCDFPAVENISNLSRLCLIEIVSPYTIRLPGILKKRFRFRDLDVDTKNLLYNHAATLYSQLARENPQRLEFAVEAEYYSTLTGKVAKIVTNLIDGRFAAAKESYEEHKFQNAHQYIKPLVTDDAPVDILRLAALIDAQLGNLESALVKVEKVLEKNPYDSYFFSVIGKTTLTQSRPEFGDRLVKIGRKTGVMETKISVFEGRLALRRRDFSKAEICFRQALTSPKTDPWAYFFLGSTYMRMGDLEEAINILFDGEKYLTQRSNFHSNVGNAIRTKLGVSYVLNGDLEAAEKILEDIKNREPDNPETLYAYWLLKVRKEGIDSASEAFDVFRTAKPKKWEMGNYHLYYGLFHKALDELKEANEHFALAYKFERSNVYIMIKYAENLYDLAILAKIDHDMDLSKSYAKKCAHVVRRIFEFDPDNPFAENLQIDLYSDFDIQLSKLKDSNL